MTQVEKKIKKLGKVVEELTKLVLKIGTLLSAVYLANRIFQ